MKWFYNQPLSNDPIELIEQCVIYLSRIGELVEREATVKMLFDEIRENDVPLDTLRRVTQLGYPNVNFWLAIHGSGYAIDALLEMNLGDQGLICNILNNPNIQFRHRDPLDKKIDGSPKGETNRMLWTRIWPD